jgi:small membrane protein
MNIFQIIAIVVLVILLQRDLRKWLRTRTARGVWFLRSVFWVLAIVAISYPILIYEIAQFINIGSAPNLLLYVSVLLFAWIAFTLYLRMLRLERQITDLTRHLAMKEAVREEKK